MSRAQDSDSDDTMDEFMEKFRKEKYKGAFNEDNWEEEFEKVPMFMRTAPKEIDPKEHPDLACLQSIIHDDDRSPEEQAKALKDEGNEYFKEKNYKKAIVSYSEALKKKSTNTDLCAVLYTNRAAAHFHLGNMRSALNDSLAAKKLKPDHVKALIRGAQCFVKLGNFSEALQWCEEGLGVHPKDVKLQELRATADKLKRTAERDARKAKVKQKKERVERDALLGAIRERGIQLLKPDKPSKHCSDSEEEDVGSTRALAELDLNDLCSKEATGFKVHLDEQGVLHWPVLFLYPEHGQTDFISSFNENDRFIDHLTVMFGEELPPWDTEKKYQPRNLELYFDDERGQLLLQLENEMSLLRVLQNDRCFVKEGTPSFIVLVRDSAFCKSFLSGKKVHRLK